MDEKESIRKRTKYQAHNTSHFINECNNHSDMISDDSCETHPQYSNIKVTNTYQNPSKMYHYLLGRLNVHCCTHVIKLITVLVMIGFVNSAPLASSGGSEENQNSFNTISKDNSLKSSRIGKSLFFNNPLTDLYFNNQYQNEELLANNNEDYMDNTDDEVMSRARPSGSNKKKYTNSPIYYIRIPPSPYVHVPGYGYVSESPSLKPPPEVMQSEAEPNKMSAGGMFNQNYMLPNQNVYQQPSSTANIPNYMSNIMNSASNYMTSQNYMNYNPAPTSNNYFPNYPNQMNLPYQNEDYNNGVYPANTFPLNNQGFNQGNANKYQNSPIYNLPLQFLANGKPTHVYTLQNEIQATPMKPSKPSRPDSPIYNLDKGPYVFNGKPTDIILLRDAYNALYDDTINNFYP